MPLSAEVHRRSPQRWRRNITFPDSSTVLDSSKGLLSTGGDVELLAELVSMFLNIVPDQVEELGDAVGAGDTLRIRRIAHNIKGSAAALGAVRIQQSATLLETCARENDLADATTLIRSIAEQIDRLEHEFRG